MSLSIKYERLEDARMRLRHTVVLYNDVPYYVREITQGNTEEDGPYRVHADALPLVSPRTGSGRAERAGPDEVGGADIRKFISSKHFDVAPFKMGFVNTKMGCFYVSRLPARQQKQGLSNENTRCVTPFGETLPFAHLLQAPEALAMVAGKYPNLVQATNALETVPSIAVCREIALVKDDVLDCLVYIYHKTSKVGILSGDKVKLGKAFVYLAETLGECGIEIIKQEGATA